jgi:biotin transport system substrate-specific component
MTWEKTFILAIAPFFPFDIIKAAMASYLGIRIRRALIQAGQVAKK